MLMAIMLWVPMCICPSCGGEGRVPGLSGLSLEKSGQLSRRQSLNRCGDCETRGRVSVLQKWTKRP